MTFKWTDRQAAVQPIFAGPATHILGEGGGRSGKTLQIMRNITMRRLKAPGSRGAVLRFRFNHLKSSIISDTFPKMMSLCFPEVKYDLDRTDWYAEFPNRSQLWFGGLDDKARLDKILGTEFADLYLNECSQISWEARETVKTRLAQLVYQETTGGGRRVLPLRMYYDWNPTTKGHWVHKLFHKKINPETGKPLENPDNYAHFKMNPEDNRENLSATYLSELADSSLRYRKRFLDGEAADENPNALFTEENIDKWRVMDGKLPDMIRIVVAVDPSGSGDIDNADNDEIGIGVAGLGTDGNAYVLEDCTVKAGPATWGNVASQAYERHSADVIVGEQNFGGEMVRFTIQAANKRAPFKMVVASRGKIVRAEPVSALYEKGKVRHVGVFRKLEDELCSFSTFGYVGSGSPNRADAIIWAISELFPGLVKTENNLKLPKNFVSPFRKSLGVV